MKTSLKSNKKGRGRERRGRENKRRKEGEKGMRKIARAYTGVDRVIDAQAHNLQGGPKKTGPLYIFPNI